MDSHGRGYKSQLIRIKDILYTIFIFFKFIVDLDAQRQE